jgi:hypothetical protein
MEVIGTLRKAFHHKVQQPRETDTYRTTAPAQRDALTQQVFNQRALLLSNDVVFWAGHKLAPTRFALMMLFAGASMAIILSIGSIGTLDMHLSRPSLAVDLHCIGNPFGSTVAGNRAASITCLALPLGQFLQQLLGVLQVSRIKALREPAVDRCQEIVGGFLPALLLPQATEAQGCP